MFDWKKEHVPIAIVTFAIFAALLMLLSVPGVAVLPLPGRRRSVESASPHSPNVIPGAVYVNFAETGLTSGTSWSVTMTPSGGFPSTKSSTTWEIQFDAAENTKYTYSVSTVFGTTPSPSSGTLNIGTQGETVDVTYTPAYTVTFSENSTYQLPSGTQWSAKLGSSTYSTTGTSISVGVSDGTYSYTVGSHIDFTQTPSSGNVTVNGTSETINVNFEADAVFQESGLPSGTTWYTSIDSGGSVSSKSQDMYFPEVGGTYDFNVSSVDGWGSNTSFGQFTLFSNLPVTIMVYFLRPFTLNTVNLMNNNTSISHTSQFNNSVLGQNTSYNWSSSQQHTFASYNYSKQNGTDTLIVSYGTNYEVNEVQLNYTQEFHNGSTGALYGNVSITEVLALNNTTLKYRAQLSADFTPADSSNKIPLGDLLIENYSSNESGQINGIESGLGALINRYESSGNSTLVKLGGYYTIIGEAFCNFTLLVPKNVTSLDISNTTAQVYDYNFWGCVWAGAVLAGLIASMAVEGSACFGGFIPACVLLYLDFDVFLPYAIYNVIINCQ